MQFESLDVEVRRARRDDAQAIGAVFDAAVRVGWTYLGELAKKPMFAPHDWEQLVADHASPNPVHRTLPDWSSRFTDCQPPLLYPLALICLPLPN